MCVSPMLAYVVFNAVRSHWMSLSGRCSTCTIRVLVSPTAFAFACRKPDSIGGVILHIINVCLIQSDIPDSWKHSKVHSLFKSGNLSDPANFRLISLGPVIMKVVERIVHKQLYAYLSHNHLLTSYQHGFRP